MEKNLTVKYFFTRLLLILILILCGGVSFARQFYPERLRCEHLDNPIAVDAGSPRFTWQFSDKSPGAMQTAYEITVDESAAAVRGGKGNVWRSGKVNSSGTLALFDGAKLKAGTRYYWGISVWNKAGRKSPVKVSWFETGKRSEPWQAKWISDGGDTLVQPAPCFRKEFVSSKKIESARLYIAAAGLFELYLNGQKIGDEFLNPMFTRFDKRNLYLKYDVTGNIKQGSNAVGVMLGNGWYNHQSWSEWNFDKAIWRNRPAFCLEIHIKYADGRLEVISSDAGWKTKHGPVIFNSIYTGEHYDARKEIKGWDLPGLEEEGWHFAVEQEAPSNTIVAQALKPVRITKVFENPECTKINDSVYVYKLPENIAGISKLSIRGERGTTIRLKHGETLDQNNRVDQSTIAIYADQKKGLDPFQTDIYILKGQGLEEFEPRFNYKGFQYVEVIADRPVNLTAKNLTAYRLNSDVEPVGAIESSNNLVNKIWAATNRSYISNLYGYPTDCPQREKNGWTGDAHIALEAGLFNYDAITVYEKWLADHRDAQLDNGMLPAIIPTSSWGYNWGNGPDWTSTMLIIPWTLYQYYGDSRALADNYPNMKRFVDYITSVSKGKLTDWGLGDWVPYKTIANKELLISLYYYQDALILSKAAGVLGFLPDAEKYKQLAGQIKDAVNTRFLDRKNAIYDEGSQSALSAPLYFGIVPDELKQKVADNLAKRVVANNKHLDVGLLGSKTLLGALSENGYADLAFEVATQQTYPSWGWWIANGATTLYETWKIETPTLSRNHIMFGEISAWFYKALGGINVDETKAGFHSITVKPHFIKSLDHFSATYNSDNGKIVSSWKRENNTVEYSLTIPANSEAKLFVENIRSVMQQGSMKDLKRVLINEDKSILLDAGTYNIIINESL